MITQTHLIPEEEKPCKPRQGKCASDGYLKTDNFLAEYSGNPAPVLNNLGVYSKDQVDKAIDNQKRLVEVDKNNGLVTITDNLDKTTSFRILSDKESYLLNNFDNKINDIFDSQLAPKIKDELGPEIADHAIVHSDVIQKMADVVIQDRTPSLVEKTVEESQKVKETIESIISESAPDAVEETIETLIDNNVPGIIDNKVPGMITTEITNTVPDLAQSAIEKDSKSENSVIKEAAQETIEADLKSENSSIGGVIDKKIEDDVPGIAKDEATKIIEENLAWNLIIDPDDEQNPIGEGNGDTTSNDIEDEDTDESGIS